jgi:hypothetical protein
VLPRGDAFAFFILRTNVAAYASARGTDANSGEAAMEQNQPLLQTCKMLAYLETKSQGESEFKYDESKAFQVCQSELHGARLSRAGLQNRSRGIATN